MLTQDARVHQNYLLHVIMYVISRTRHTSVVYTVIQRQIDVERMLFVRRLFYIRYRYLIFHY